MFDKNDIHFVLFKRSPNKFTTEGYTSPVTLWNKLTSGEMKKISKVSRGGGFGDIQIRSLLQPGWDGDCVSLLLIFETVPSWYSMPCDKSFPTKILICKRHMQQLRRADDYTVKHQRKISCRRKDLILFDSCFGENRGLYLSSHGYFDSDIYYLVYHQYVSYLFSIITRHTLESYQLHIFGSQSQDNKTAVCLTALRQEGLANDYTRYVRVWERPCDPKTSSPTITFVPSKKKQHTHCLPNQFHCSDGECVAQNHVCSTDIPCASSICSCESNGDTVSDVYFCHKTCMPNDCVCSQHQFQCISGGCIDMASVCDGQINCADASDEICVTEFMASENDGNVIEITINNRNFCLGFVCESGQCLNMKYVDDLLPDCPGGQGEDEAKMLQLRFEGRSFACENPAYFPCVSGLSVCFPLHAFCTYDPDEDGHPKWCKDGVHVGDCSGINCTNSYKCPESYCILYHRVCDGQRDCIHGEDEEHCDEYICKGLLRCLGTKICVHPTQVCDGVKHCPNADDEELCEATLCPKNCGCLSYSIICTTEITNTFPIITSVYFKHVALVGSYMPYPDFNNICNQMNILFMNLSRNNVRDICLSLQNIDKCKLRGKVILFDLSYNDITQLQSFCFRPLTLIKILNLEHNPLHTIHNNAFSSSSISYISLHGTKLISLSRAIVSGLKTLHILDITENKITSVDNVARDIMSDIPCFKFNDVRLCCIFDKIKQCGELSKEAALCPTLLPVPTMGYTLSTMGTVLLIYNIIALYATLRFRRFVHQYTFTSFLISIDAILAIYVPTIGAADLYYNTQFVLSMNQWAQNTLCRLMENMFAITTFLSIYNCGLHIYLMKQAITRLRFNIHDVWNKLVTAEIMITMVIVVLKITLTLVDIFEIDSQRSVYYRCNIMGDFDVTTITSVVWVVTLCIAMVTSHACIVISVVKIIKHMTAMTECVEDLINNKNALFQNRSGVRNVLILFLITKTLTYLPYPFFLLWCSLSGTGPHKNTLQYLTLIFIFLECFANPAMFAFRPLWIHWLRNHSVDGKTFGRSVT